MSKTKGSLAVTPLYNFDSTVESLKFDEMACLRRVSNDELDNIKKSFPNIRGVLQFALSNVRYVLEMGAIPPIEDETATLFDHTQPRVDNVILALRLLKPGDVGIPCRFLVDQKWQAYAHSFPTIPLITSPVPYFLKQEEVETLTTIWTELQDIKQTKPHLNFTLFQFTRAFDQKYPEDRIVNYITAFESVVFHNEPKSIEPAGKVIGIAIGMLLGNCQEDRDEIKKVLTKSYAVRNVRVHGNVVELNKLQRKLDINNLTSCVEDLLRRVLRKLIEE